jgi:hypothetical protein
MGWSVTDDHCYSFITADMAVFGPPIDHYDRYGHELLGLAAKHLFFGSARGLPLGGLLRAPSESLTYVLNPSDGWQHAVILEAVHERRSAEAATTVELVDGQGACPPVGSVGDSMNGPDACARFLASYRALPASQQREEFKRFRGAANYKTAGPGGQVRRFEPDTFDLPDHRRALAEALESAQRDGDELPWWERPSSTAARRCAKCSTPESLSQKLRKCARCGTVVYCDVGCQRADWREHRKVCAAIAESAPAASDGTVAAAAPQ